MHDHKKSKKNVYCQIGFYLLFQIINDFSVAR